MHKPTAPDLYILTKTFFEKTLDKPVRKVYNKYRKLRKEVNKMKKYSVVEIETGYTSFEGTLEDCIKNIQGDIFFEYCIKTPEGEIYEGC